MDHTHGHAPTSDPSHAHKMAPHGGHDRHAGHSVAMFRDKFWLSFALTIPVVVWSADVQHWLGYTAPSFPGSKFIPAVLGTIVFIYGGLVFIRGAWGELADRKPGMMTLISLAIIVAFGTSLAATFGLFEIEVWWELASLITIMVLGHWLEMKAISQARGALNALAALLPDTAERLGGTDTQTVPISELKVGDVVLVRPGTRVPADGMVVEGAADVDESMITGESRTVAKGVRGQGHCGNGSQRGESSSPCYGCRGADSAVRHHAASGGCTGVWISHASSRRPCRRNPFLRRRCVRRNHFRLLVVFRRQRTCPDQDGNRPHHCVPACLGIGDSTRDCNLHFTRSPERSSREGQTRTRTCPQSGYGDFR